MKGFKISSRMIKITALAMIGWLNFGAVTASTKLLSQPDISDNQITFVYAGDIWIAEKDGSSPKRLTSMSADEQNPYFSPDGKWIAFSANYNNNFDVYLIPTSGGQARRLTWHPGADWVNGWSPDGKSILFTSRREMQQGRSAQAWQVSAKGGFPTRIMDAVVQQASWSADGKTLAYQPYITAHRGPSGWRNHRGGSTPPIWILSPGANNYIEIPHVRASDTNPMWVGGDVFFISDRDRAKNIYQYQLKDKKLIQKTQHKNWDIQSANTDGKTIIFSSGGELHLLNPENNKVTDISIDIHPDLPELRTQWKDAMPAMEKVVFSPTGKRALISARGEIFTVPLKEGSVRNLTKTDGIRERDGLWSPKGDKIAYSSDKDGVQKLIIRDQYGDKIIHRYALGKPADYQLLLWAGKGNKIIYADNHLHLWSININSGKRRLIDTNNRRSPFNISLSKDGRWLAYNKSGANFLSNINLYDFKSATQTVLTDGMSLADNPVFSPDGKYLYFTASTNAGTTAVGLDMSTQERPVRMGIYAFVLAKDGKSPLIPTSDEEEIKNKDKKTDKDKTDDKNEKDNVVKVDLNGIQNRMVALPVDQKAYSALNVTADGNLLYINTDQPGDSVKANGNPDNDSRLVYFDMEDQKDGTIVEHVRQFKLSEDGKHLLAITNEGKIVSAEIKEKIKAPLKTEPLNTADVKLEINPRHEWSQIFNEVWRTERDYFYAKNMHGLDWKVLGTKYRNLLPWVARRADLNRLMVDMISEMEVGHNRVFGGDLPKEKPVPVGLLGADIRLKNNTYVVEKIYTGENWNPALKAPLAAPGLGIKVGDSIVAVNGTAVDGSRNLFSLFENTVGKQVTLTVKAKNRQLKSKHKIKNKTHKVIVEPIANERGLRFWSWIEENRKAVDKATKGKVGYVYLPDTAAGGFTLFNRMFFAQTDKKAMIIDERRNSGGQAANYITDILTRKYLASWKDRDGMLFDTPGGAVYGPKVMLIDQDAGSGGDFLPYSFKRLKIGKLIGKTTWGGLIGIAANRQTIDGGMVLVPFFRFFTPEGEWHVENEGVSPDLDVVLNPVLVNKGRDTQLEAAIKEVLSELKTYKPIKREKAPELPTKVGQ